MRTLAAAVLLLPWLAAAEPIPLAIAEFDYRDLSGEPGDQRAAHASRLQAFGAALQADLQQDSRLRVVRFDCGDHCAAEPGNLDRLSREARTQGARMLLFGFIHKESTLIEWARAELIDVAADTVVCEFYLSFRGDDDRAWQRAETYLARQLVAAPQLAR